MDTLPRKILLIEDNPGDARLIRALLAEEPGRAFELAQADRLATGLAYLAEHGADIVLLDLSLPDSRGLDTVARTHAQAPAVPIVVLTGHDDSALALKALENGAQDYLVKGEVDGRALHRAIWYAIERETERRAAAATLAAKNDELHAMTQQLWQTAKLATMGELAASIAHELNNPLGTVSLRVESLLGQVAPDDPKHRELMVIEEEVERMSALVANLLQFSRRSTAQISTIDVRQEIENTQGLIHHLLRQNRIDLRLEFAADVPMVQADRQQLRQVLLNLFANAADAMPQGGQLTVRVSPAEHQVSIEITDTGLGIAPEDLSKVMEPFFSTKPEGKGTGLGLPICRRIAQEHGGTLDITSAGLGQGATVRLTLPSKTNSHPTL